MNDRQRRFVAEYAIDGNATQAAIRAGYSATNADVTGPRLLGNVGVRAAVDELRAKQAEEAGLSVQWVLDGLKRNYERAMEAEIKEFRPHMLPPKRGQTEERFVLAAVYDYDGATANRSLELIGKHLGMWDRAAGDDGADVVERVIFERRTRSLT